MAATSDLIQERKRVRRLLAIWRGVAVLAVLAAIVLALPRAAETKTGEHVARIWITGTITTDRDRDEALKMLAEAEDAKALIVRINTPGGTVTGSEALYDSLRQVAAAKPVVAVMEEAATSGGYLAAIAADHILARQTTLTGSIGVVFRAPNVSKLLDSVGVEMTEVKSGPLKASPSVTTPTDPEAVAALEATILDTYAWFRGLVSERRGLTGDRLERVTDGRVFTGRQAMELGLVDALGAPREARAWLELERDIDRDLKIVDYRWGERDVNWLLRELVEGTIGSASFDPGLELGGPRLMAIFWP